MGFIYGMKYIFFKGNLPKTYFPTSWLRQRSVHIIYIYIYIYIYYYCPPPIPNIPQYSPPFPRCATPNSCRVGWHRFRCFWENYVPGFLDMNLIVFIICCQHLNISSQCLVMCLVPVVKGLSGGGFGLSCGLGPRWYYYGMPSTCTV